MLISIILYCDSDSKSQYKPHKPSLKVNLSLSVNSVYSVSKAVINYLKSSRSTNVLTREVASLLGLHSGIYRLQLTVTLSEYSNP